MDMTREDMEDLRADRILEARQDEELEMRLRSDYDYFVDYWLGDSIEELDEHREKIRKILQYIVEQHEQYGWEYYKNDFIDI